MPIPAIAFAPALFNTGLAAIQALKAKKLKKDTYIPPALLEAERSARGRANATVTPGNEVAKDALAKSAANKVRRAERASGGNSADINQATSEAQIIESEGVQKIATSNARFKIENQRNLERIMLNKARFEQENEDAFQGAKSALTGAAIQNVQGAITDSASVAILNDPKVPQELKDKFSRGDITKEALRKIIAGLGIDNPTFGMGKGSY